MNMAPQDFHFYPVHRYDYSHWFETVSHNGRTLNEKERTDFIAMTEETISQYEKGLPLIQDSLDGSKELADEFHKIDYILSSVMMFVLITMIDNMVAGKYFIKADTDYDRSFMRGKMKVILNEGFKRLYGFEPKTRKKSEWSRLEPLMKYFPDEIKRQYEELSKRLENHAQPSDWWRDERNLETHLEAEKLYVSRKEEVVESKVMMDSLKLFNTLHAVNLFLSNAHSCLTNFLVKKYIDGEMRNV